MQDSKPTPSKPGREKVRCPGGGGDGGGGPPRWRQTLHVKEEEIEDSGIQPLLFRADTYLLDTKPG